jgi:hypothetical protein
MNSITEKSRILRLLM